MLKAYKVEKERRLAIEEAIERLIKIMESKGFNITDKKQDAETDNS